MWIPVAMTICVLTLTEGTQCFEDDEWPDTTKFETEIECQANMNVAWANIAGRGGLPINSLMAECKEHEGDPA